jgi:hypothetical protein
MMPCDERLALVALAAHQCVAEVILEECLARHWHPVYRHHIRLNSVHRHLHALRLRYVCGWDYLRIGEELGVSHQRARQMVQMANRWIRNHQQAQAAPSSTDAITSL